MTRGDPEAAHTPRRILTPLSGVMVGAGSLLCLAGALGSLPDRSQHAAEFSAPTPPSAPAPLSPETTCADDLKSLRLGLRRLHQGEETDKERLTALAERLDMSCRRHDALRVTRHLTSLSLAEATAAGTGIDQVQAVLDSYGTADGSDPPLQRDNVFRSLESLTQELDLLTDPLPAAYARRILAELHLRAGDDADPELAALLAENALETYGRVGFYEQEIEVLEVLARAHLLVTDLRSAHEEATRGLTIAQRIEDPLYESLFLRTLVRVADRTGTGLERERLLREWGGLALDHHRCDVEEWWAWTRETVTWLIDEDHPTQALTFLQDALADRSEAQGVDPLSSHTLRRQARTLKATVLIRAREYARASELLEQGATYNDRTRLLRAYLNLKLLQDADEGEARTLLSELAVLLSGDWVSALPPELLDEGEIYTGEYHFRRGQPVLARASLERAVRRALQLDRGLAARASLDETASLGGEALGLHAIQLLARTYLELDRPLLAARIAEEMQARSLRQDVRALKESDILSWAGDNELGLVTWILGPDEGVAIWIGREGQSGSMLIPFGRRPLQRAVGRLSQALREGSSGDAESFGAELARSLLPEELLQRLSSCHGESLLLLTHGPLELLPVGALRVPNPDTPTGALLAEAATLRVLPGLPAAHPGEAKSEPAEWILVGAPTDRIGHTRLPEALEELQQIAERRRCAVLVGSEMTRAKMISVVESEACLHIATHVEWVDTKAGPAPALEISNNELFTVGHLSEHIGSRELVILAGCETAGGRVLDGEGVLGFAHAFLASGTRGVVATLWPVDDGAAREFGVALHEGLLAKRSPSAAVRSAGRRLRDAGRADWAAFQLLGRD